jgi:hypothetical protein
MFLNEDKILKTKLDPCYFFCLQIIYQQRFGPNEDLVALYLQDGYLEDMFEKGYIKENKTPKNDSVFSKLRATKKGVDFLQSYQAKYEGDEEDEIVYKWIMEQYKKRPNYVKSNHKKSQRLLNWFKKETGISGNKLSTLLKCFMKDTYIDNPNDKRSFNEKFSEFKQENPRAQLSNKIENLLWTPENHFQTQYSLESSPLYEYYNQFEDYVESEYKKEMLKKQKQNETT